MNTWMMYVPDVDVEMCKSISYFEDILKKTIKNLIAKREMLQRKSYYYVFDVFISGDYVIFRIKLIHDFTPYLNTSWFFFAMKSSNYENLFSSQLSWFHEGFKVTIKCYSMNSWIHCQHLSLFLFFFAVAFCFYHIHPG